MNVIDDEHEENTAIDIRISNELFNKMKVAEFTSVFFAFVGISLSIIIYEIKNLKDLEGTTNLVLSYNGACTVGLILSLFIRYDLHLKWFVSRGLLTEYDNLKSTGWW